MREVEGFKCEKCFKDDRESDVVVTSDGLYICTKCKDSEYVIKVVPFMGFLG